VARQLNRSWRATPVRAVSVFRGILSVFRGILLMVQPPLLWEEGKITQP